MYDTETNKWMSEPPEWPIIRGEHSSSDHNLFDFLRCEHLESNEFGNFFSLEELVQFCQVLEIDIQANTEPNILDSNQDKNVDNVK